MERKANGERLWVYKLYVHNDDRELSSIGFSACRQAITLVLEQTCTCVVSRSHTDTCIGLAQTDFPAWRESLAARD